jgi:HPt (histidine-containing phosphotransfer) domain-containing protein
VSADQDPVDPVVIARLRDLGGPEDPGFLKGLVDEFLAHADRSVDQLRSAADAGDAKRLADLAHALKGSAANLGARALSAHAAEIERAGKAGEPRAARDPVEAAAAELARVRVRLVEEAGKAAT